MSASCQQATFAPYQIAALFDHLVSAGEQCGWYSKTESLGSFEIDHQFVFRRCLHRHVRWLLALEDAIHVASGAVIGVKQIRAIRNQATCAYEVAGGVDCGQFVLGRKRDDHTGMVCPERTCSYNQPAIRATREFRD